MRSAAIHLPESASTSEVKTVVHRHTGKTLRILNRKL